MSKTVNPAVASMMRTMLGIDPDQLAAIAKDAADKLDSFDKRMNELLEKQAQTNRDLTTAIEGISVLIKHIITSNKEVV